MELTKTETKLVVIAVGIAIEQQNLAIRRLEREQPGTDIRTIIAERTRNILDLDKLRHRLMNQN